MNITELKNKLEGIDIEIDKQNKLDDLLDYERTKPRIRNNNHIKREICRNGF